MKTCEICKINTHSEASCEMVALVWLSLKKDRNHTDRCITSYGTKTKCGLMACFDSIMVKHDKVTETDNSTKE